ncbi:E3 ubiquitin-protein ligase TRIM71-like [Saccostrea cucullata]|uniref:E3 ubiquitin-protein ligase TRIM71-like n=1 Tax=Saccostrea cuccullata TaxID=36930 RepID=UPI002ED10EF3
MDPRTSAQDVMRCDLCETAVVQMHCDTCLVNLCKACVGEHISDESKDHKVVKFQSRKSTLLHPQCALHDKKRCDMYCEQCDIPLCSACIVSENHSGHKILEIIEIYHTKKMEIEKENEEMRKSIYPIYEDIASDAEKRISQLDKGYEGIATTITNHGEEWHRQIDKLVNKLKAEVDNMKAIHKAALEKHRAEINQRISDIDDKIRKLTKLLESNDISLFTHHNITVAKFRKLPPIVDASFPNFTPIKFQEEPFQQLFGKLSSLSLTSEEYGYNSKLQQISPEAGSFPPIKKILDEPEIVTTIDTEYENANGVACLSEEQIWTAGNSSSIKLFNINQGSILQSITTRSGNGPSAIAVTKNGELVYADKSNRNVNIVKNKKIEEVIKLQNWAPLGVCYTSSGDLLVTMYSDENRKSKVVRFFGSTEKQTIQIDDKGQPLYSNGSFTKYISENKNLDICVSDWGANAVVVVNQAGKLRFRYTGLISAQNKKEFSPYGITTDSQSHILTADCNNHRVHIIDQDGQFLRYLYCGLNEPFGLCTDTNDNLFVAQISTSKVKKIKYLH